MAVDSRDQRVCTPEENRYAPAMKITQSQRQALLDNLQLEITERARKLRAQYTLQAQGLRARLEMRVNRIPTSLRKRNLQELLDEHAQNAKPARPPPMPVVKRQQPALQAPPPRHSLKRKSDHFGEDKENNAAHSTTGVENPKKRSKITATKSKAIPPAGGVLSPKSHNSRTLPQSPLKATERPRVATTITTTSPVKATQKVGVKSGQPALSRKPSKRVVKDDPRPSGGSDTSNGTTIIKRSNSRKAPAAAKKPAAAKPATTARRGAAAKKDATSTAAASTTTASGRTLRKRG